jgi:hypothetical protein
MRLQVAEKEADSGAQDGAKNSRRQRSSISSSKFFNELFVHSYMPKFHLIQPEKSDRCG